jgi:serine phosphatase RsbU (regulator of sigma subunit)
LKAAIQKFKLNSGKLGTQILQTVKTFAGQAEQYDDMTLVIIGRDQG